MKVESKPQDTMMVKDVVYGNTVLFNGGVCIVVKSDLAKDPHTVLLVDLKTGAGFTIPWTMEVTIVPYKAVQYDPKV
ncbi:hypothetical protein M0R72_10505 [Candidatus Pacearchaeota archaeon]|nr:hypothetical protein [Candidatus Pacearchaeota archaeon]